MHLLVNTDQPAYAGILAQLENAFKARWPDNIFEPTLNVAGTRAIIEVPDDVPQSLLSNPATLDHWLDDEHQAKLVQINFYSPEWQPPNEEL